MNTKEYEIEIKRVYELTLTIKHGSRTFLGEAWYILKQDMKNIISPEQYEKELKKLYDLAIASECFMMAIEILGHFPVTEK